MNGHFSYKGKALCQLLNTGKAPLHGRSQCPAKEAICHKCGKRGHYKSMCKSKPGASVRIVYIDDTNSDAFLGTVHSDAAALWTGCCPKPKFNGSVRICVDLTELNESVCWERHILPLVEQTLAQIANSGF